VIAWSFALGLFSLFAQALQPLPQVTPPPTIGSPSAQACARCHPKEYAAWQDSRHAHAYDNRLFLSSFRREPMPWCIYCHAPLPAQARAALGTSQQRLNEPLLREGINCAICHVRDGAILSSHAPTAAASAAHAMRYEPLLGKSEFCGACHQFNFPHQAEPFRYGATPMQNTLSEWQKTTRGMECQECHMPRGAHRFPGGHDAELLRDRLSLALTRSRGNIITVALRARGIGHNFPTGDPFRRLRLELCDEAACDEPALVLLFRRTFVHTKAGWELDHDTTLPPPGPSGESLRTVSIELPAELRAAAPIHYRLSYAYAAPSTEDDLRPEERAVELIRGQLQ